MSNSPATGPTVRFPEDDKPSTRAKAYLMAAMQERLLTYRQPVDLRRPETIEALDLIYRDEYGRALPTADLDPGDQPIRYLVALGTEPVLLTEDEVLPFVFALAMASGKEGHRRVWAERFNYRKGLLSA